MVREDLTRDQKVEGSSSHLRLRDIFSEFALKCLRAWVAKFTLNLIFIIQNKQIPFLFSVVQL